MSLSLTISSVFALGLLVIVRTTLGFTIQTEREGDLPWRVGGSPGPSGGAIRFPSRP